MKGKYKSQFNLHHNEIPAVINSETGEIKELFRRPNNIPNGKEVFEEKGDFKKDYSKSWKYLKSVLTHTEYSAAHTLALMAKMNTNSLEPISDETPQIQLEQDLGLSKNVVKKTLARLFHYGVYGKFEVSDPKKPYTKFWIINPYLSFSGKLIDSDIKNLFEGTYIARAYRNEIL